MSGYVLDASVAAKWFLSEQGETFVSEAVEILDRYRGGKADLAVPDLFWPEFGNILGKAQRRGRMERETARKAVDSMTEVSLKTYPSRTLLRDACAIAFTFDRAVYDAIYVALAVELDKPLVTADEKLANALAARFPIRWLGAFS